MALREDDPLRQLPDAVFRRLLVAADPISSGARQYRPLQEPALHRVLVAVDLSEPGIVKFANKYGTLGLNRQSVDLTGRLDLNLIPIFPADSWADWTAEIKDLREAVALWDKVKQAKRELPDDLDRIVAMIKVRLDDLHGVPSRRTDNRGLVMKLGPKSLCAAAWLQFEQETERYFDLKQCCCCGRWFKYYPEQLKTPRIFCSQACRSKAYRQRQDEARQLHGNGLAAVDIATKIGSDAATIEKWIRSNRRSRGA